MTDATNATRDRLRAYSGLWHPADRCAQYEAMLVNLVEMIEMGPRGDAIFDKDQFGILRAYVARWSDATKPATQQNQPIP